MAAMSNMAYVSTASEVPSTRPEPSKAFTATYGPTAHRDGG
jgi:hypothetical protein